MENLETKKLFTKKALISLTVPLIIEQLLAVTIGLVDTIMVASVGEAAVSGISLVESINVLLINIFSALATGGAVIASQYMGRKDYTNARVAAKQLIYSITALALIIMMLSLVFSKAILHLMFGNIDGDVMKNAEIFFLISAISYPFLAAYNGGTAIFRSMGNSKISMYTSLFMNIINVIGNAVMIYIFKWGTAGSATATLISRILGAVIILKLVQNKKNTIFIEDIFKWEFRRTMVKNILRIGIPTGLENGIFQIGKVLVLGLVAGFGTSAIAANAIANNMASITTIPGVAVGLVLVTVVGQCVGAKDYEQAKFYIRKLMIGTYVIMGVLNLAMFIFVNPIVNLFNLSIEATTIAKDLMHFYTITCALLWPMAFTFPNALRAAGDTKFTMTASIFSMWIFRIGCSYILSITFGLGVMGVWMAMVVDWIARTTIFVVRYLRGKWKKIKVI